MLRPVRLVELYSVPAFHSFTDQLCEGHAPALWTGVPQQAPCSKQFYEPKYVRVRFQQRPIKPVECTVIAVCVVVAMLCSPDLVTHGEHGKSEREQRSREEVFYLAIAESLNSRIIGRPLDAAIPA